MPEKHLLVREVARDAVVVEGPDSESWLQGQVSQDVSAMVDGELRHSLVLSPQGKLVSLCRVARLSEGLYLLDTERGYGGALAERLGRFKLRVKLTLEESTAVCREEAGLGWDSLGVPRVLGPGEPSPPGQGDDPSFEAARILGGVPRQGRELTERTIPQEAGPEFVRRTVSFAKGCYTGQELVARLDARGGRVPRQLRLVSTSSGPVSPGAAVRISGEGVGEVTSAAPAGDGSWVALAYVKRAALADEDQEGEVEVGGGGGAPATLRPLPVGRPPVPEG